MRGAWRTSGMNDMLAGFVGGQTSACVGVHPINVSGKTMGYACDEAAKPRSAPIGILNGFGRTLGDGIVGLQALSVAILVGALPERPILFRLPNLPAMVRAIYAVADFAETRTLPWDFATNECPFEPDGPFARVIDMRDFAFDPDFHGTAMIDFFLRKLGVQPGLIPASRRRNTWLAPRVLPVAPDAPAGYILICPKASMQLRDMPTEIHAHIVRKALDVGPVVTQGHAPGALVKNVVHAAPCATLGALCGLVRGARLVVSTDTAMVHLADAFDVPCLAFFPTHRPEWRVRDYPHCQGISLPGRLPLGIEFARGPEDEQLARSAWFPDGNDFGWLDRVMIPMLEQCAR